MSKPLWREAIDLATEYKKRGIGYCYNQSNHNVYLSVLNAPYLEIGTPDCHLTGYLIIYGGVVASRDVDIWANAVKRNYIKSWENNSDMLKFAETIQIEA